MNAAKPAKIAPQMTGGTEKRARADEIELACVRFPMPNEAKVQIKAKKIVRDRLFKPPSKYRNAPPTPNFCLICCFSVSDTDLEVFFSLL